MQLEKKYFHKVSILIIFYTIFRSVSIVVKNRRRALRFCCPDSHKSWLVKELVELVVFSAGFSRKFCKDALYEAMRKQPPGLVLQNSEPLMFSASW